MNETPQKNCNPTYCKGSMVRGKVKKLSSYRELIVQMVQMPNTTITRMLASKENNDFLLAKEHH